MPDAIHLILYSFLFVSLFYEVFLLITYFERRPQMREEKAQVKRGVKTYPSVTILVPCWNEEKTISKTIHSLLSLDYPKAKLSIIIIDDGSTDKTWQVIQKFTANPQVNAYQKQNGGKHTALNFGLTHVTSEFVGCLDADSYVHKDALKNIMVYFQDKETMAVTPSIKIWQPTSVIQLIQRVEYGWGIFVRKMLSYLGAMYVTPGPFTIFRTTVFAELGGYRHAHQTEDMELALRMQANKYKIVNCHSAEVYTVAPPSLYKLYKQRLRWTYGFIQNIIDYRFLFFKQEYGNLGFFVLPIASVSIFSSLYAITVTLVALCGKVWREYVKIRTVGFDFNWPHFQFDWFFVNTEFIAILSAMIFLVSVTILLLSRRMTEGKIRIGMDLIYFMTLYTFIAPLWIGKAVYNTVFSVKTTWR